MNSEFWSDFNGIEEYRNAFDSDWCKKLIDLFEERSKMQLTEYQRSGKNQDQRIFMDVASHNKMYHVDSDVVDEFYTTVAKWYEEQYKAKYTILTQEKNIAVCQHSPKGMSIQKSLPHQGYHYWHCETGSISTSCRAVTYTLYLNNVEKGGETEFIYAGIKVKPEEGKLIFFPTNYIATHRGNPLYKGVKYLVSGWYTWDE